MAAAWGSVRRATRRAWVNDSVSGSRARGQGAERGLVHQRADREVREEKAPRFLSHELRGLAPQDTLATPETCLEFVERRFHLPALMVERRQFLRRRALGLQYRGDQPIRRFGRGNAGERRLDHAHRD